MLTCKWCNSPEIKIISSDPFGDEVVVHCINCGEIFELDKEDVDDAEDAEENEYHED